MSVEEEVINGEVVPTEFHVTEVPATLPEHSGEVLRVVSKPAILGAPYSLENAIDLSDELNSETSGLAAFAKTLIEHNEDGTNEVEHVKTVSEEEAEVVPGYLTVVATVLQLSREFESLQDNLTKLFKHLGHEAEWKKIINN